MFLNRTEAAYWLTLTFKLEGERRKERNGLVLTAGRRLGMGILDLVQLDLAALPDALVRFRATLERLQSADGEVSGMAFLVDELAERGVELLPITHPAYPAHLARTLKPEAAPTLLSVCGDPNLLAAPGACVSGSRKASAGGLAFARICGETLAGAGITVVTGLAAGPDREALAGCLERGGKAIGVAPEGILASRAARDPMVRSGHLCVISEFHPKQKWQAGLAMARNRTLAGMSRILFVADCVDPGGTTNQVEVHRAVALPVFVRRGVDEGAMVASLATWPGVTPLSWESGPLDLPVVVTGAGTSPLESQGGPQSRRTPEPMGPLQAVQSPPVPGRSNTGIMELEDMLAVRRREVAEIEAALAVRRAEMGELEDRLRRARQADAAQKPGPPESPSLLTMVREPDPGPYAAGSAEESPTLKERVLVLLRADETPKSPTEIANALGVSESKARVAVKAAAGDGSAEPVKVGRATKYTVPKAIGLFTPHPERS